MRLVSHALEEFNSFLSFQVFETSVVLDEALFVRGELDVFEVDEALLSYFTSFADRTDGTSSVTHSLNFSGGHLNRAACDLVQNEFAASCASLALRFK